MSSTSFCLRRLSILLHFEGTLKNQVKEFQIKIKISKCLWTIYNIRRISSSNSINDNNTNGLKMKFIYLSKPKSFSCAPVNWLNVLFRRDRNLKCDPTKTKLFQSHKKENENKLTFYRHVIAFELYIAAIWVDHCLNWQHLFAMTTNC